MSREKTDQPFFLPAGTNSVRLFRQAENKGRSFGIGPFSVSGKREERGEGITPGIGPGGFCCRSVNFFLKSAHGWADFFGFRGIGRSLRATIDYKEDFST